MWIAGINHGGFPQRAILLLSWLPPCSTWRVPCFGFISYCSGAAVYLGDTVWPDRENGKLSIQTELPFPLSQHPVSVSRNPHTHTRGLTLILTISLMSQKPQFCSFMYNRELKYCSPVCTFVTWCTAALSGQSTNLLVHCSAFSCCDSSSVNELSFWGYFAYLEVIIEACVYYRTHR